jgi:adenylate kinase
MPKLVVLMGAPGAGKGTQARLLQERLGLPQISTGDIFRELARAETPLAAEVRAIQASGELISDELVIRVVEERISRDDCDKGCVLDGFPRTAVQAEMLEKLAERQHDEIVAILCEVPLDILEKRTAGRRSCPICGEIFNVYFRPPKFDNVCDFHPTAQLIHRPDDVLEKIQVRLKEYLTKTTPVLEYYESTGRLRRVDGTRDPELVYQDIERIVVGEEALAG